MALANGGKMLARFGISALALMAAFAPALAQADQVAIRAGGRGDGARMIFDWPTPVEHTARLLDRRVVVTFARPLETSVNSIPTLLMAWVSEAKLSGDGHTLTLSLKRNASLQAFTSGSKVVIDLMPPAATPAKPQITSRPAAKPQEAKPVQAQTMPAEPKPAVATLPETKPIEPKPSEPQPPALPAGPEGEGAAAVPNVEGAPQSAPPAQPLATEHHSEAAPTETPAPALEQHVIPAVSKPDDAPAPAAAPQVKDVTSAALPATALPPLEMSVAPGTPVAAFRRGNSFFIIVGDSNTPRELIPLVGAALASTQRVELIPAQGGRVIRVDLKDDEIQAAIESDSNGWRLRFDATQPMAITPIELKEEPDYALGPRLLAKSDSAANPVTFVDPVVGDTLTAVPIGKLAAGVTTTSQYVQAELLPTVQGIAVRPWTDDLNVISSPMGVEVSATSGFKLSEHLSGELSDSAPTSEKAQLEAPPVPVLPPLLDFTALGVPAGADYTNQREQLQNAIIGAPEDSKPAARLNLARFYFINGMPTEAAALWDMVAKDNADLAQRPEYPLVRAIAAFSSGTNDEAKAALTAVGQPTTDLALWRGYLAVKERDWIAASEQFRASLDRIWDYPDPYKSRLAIAAVEAALNTQDYSLAESLLNKMEMQRRITQSEISPAEEYLTGVLDWGRDKEDEARAHLGSAAASWNQYWRVRADLALIDADAKKPDANPYDLLKRVERLRYAWRGDSLEFDILYRLSKMHLGVGEYAAAFEDYAQMVSKFPDDPRTPGLADEQKAAFIRIFQGEERDKTPAYVQLAIWDRFPEFRPVQPEVLNEVRGYLAERVAAIDLLDRAAAFYSDMLAAATTPEIKAQLGARVAGLRLLDDKSAEALKILTETEPAAGSDRPQVLPDALRDERRILKARAVYEQGKPDDALALLVNDYSEPAMRLRADITWRSKRWSEAAAVLDALIGDLPADGTLSDDKAGMVVSRATALALAGDKTSLTNLRQKYGPAMAQTTQAAAFQLVTRPDVAGGLPDRNTLSGRMAEVDLFQQFLEKYRQPVAQPAESPSAAVAEAPAQLVGPGATPHAADAPH